MRRFALSALLIVTACAPRPAVQTPADQPVIQRSPAAAASRNDLMGMSSADLIGLFGTPALQVREGPGLKLQFRSRSCVLDAYLYPEPTVERVTYVEARLPSGDPANAQSCYDTLKR